MRLFLGAHGTGLALAGVEQAGFLVDPAAILEDADLAAGLIFDGLAHEADRVDVLDFAAGAEFSPGAAHRDVDVGPQRALFHVAVAGAEIAHDLAQLRDIGLGLVSRAHVGLRHDLHQGAAGAVEVDEAHAGVLVVERLAGVLLEVQALDADLDGAAVDVDVHRALAHHRLLVLRDLVALRQVGVEIVLAVEDRALVDLGLQPQPGAHRLLDAEFIDHRQHAGHGGVDQRDVVIGRAAEFGGGAGEQLGLGQHLGMDLEAEDDFPVAGRSLDPVLLLGHALRGFQHASHLRIGALVATREPGFKTRAWPVPGRWRGPATRRRRQEARPRP